MAVDDLLHVASFPAADGKTPVLRRERQCGGTTTTALVAAARLGARCAYAGVLGTDDDSRFAADRLEQEGIDLRAAPRRDGARPIRATVILDDSRQTRSVLYDLDGALGAIPTDPPEEVIRAAKVLLVDTLGMEGMIRAARIARQAGLPVVGDLESDATPLFGELLALVDHLILGEDFARHVTGAPDAAAACRRLWSETRQSVVVTCGAAGCWYVGQDMPQAAGSQKSLPQHLPAWSVQAIDTTGCGDVFHGAYAAALAAGEPLLPRLRWASAAAALKAARPGGQSGAPYREDVERLLAGG